MDENDNEISIPEFVKNYSIQVDLTNYFSEPNLSTNHNKINEEIKLLYGDGQ